VRRQDGGGSEEEVALFLSHLLEEMGLDVVVEEVEPGALMSSVYFRDRKTGHA